MTNSLLSSIMELLLQWALNKRLPSYDIEWWLSRPHIFDSQIEMTIA